jgi:putative ABC transport system permease protein
MQFLWMTLIVAFRVLGRHRLRSALTMLGMVIGVAAVIAMVSIGAGAKAAVQTQLATFGTNVITVLPGASTSGGLRSGYGGVVTLTINDMQELKKIPFVTQVGWHRTLFDHVLHENKNWQTRIGGISLSYFIIRDWSLASGDFFTQADMDGSAKAAVLGKTIVQNLYDPGEDPVGSMIRIRSLPFQIVGTLAPKGFDAQGNDQDDIVFIPFSTAERKLVGSKFLGSVSAGFLSVEDPEHMGEVVEEVKRVLRERHRLRPAQVDDFTVRNQLDMMKVQASTSESMTMLLLAVASVSLLVGGIGIMNILLVSVNERTREIGIRLAVGAKRGHILLQFLIEALVLSTIGGSVGILVGLIGASVASQVAGWPTIVPMGVIVGAFAFSGIVGVFFGLYPANKASLLNPIKAIRQE